MRKLHALLLAIGILVANLSPASLWAQTLAGFGGANTRVTYVRDVLPIVLGRCYSCHNDQTKFLKNWSDYPAAFEHRQEIKRRVWDSWQGRYYKETMPAGNSPQCLAMTVAERQTLKDWVEQGAVYGVPPATGGGESRTEKVERGRKLFTVACIPCHQANGRGVPERFPPLAQSDFLNSDKNRAIRVLLDGRQGEIVVNGHTFSNSMPKFPLTDTEIAGVLTYVYNSFGNSGQEVSIEEVKRLRAQKGGSSPEPTALQVAPPNKFE